MVRSCLELGSLDDTTLMMDESLDVLLLRFAGTGGAFCRLYPLYSYRPHVASIAAYLAFPVGVAFPEGPELCTITMP